MIDKNYSWKRGRVISKTEAERKKNRTTADCTLIFFRFRLILSIFSWLLSFAFLPSPVSDGFLLICCDLRNSILRYVAWYWKYAWFLVVMWWNYLSCTRLLRAYFWPASWVVSIIHYFLKFFFFFLSWNFDETQNLPSSIASSRWYRNYPLSTYTK